MSEAIPGTARGRNPGCRFAHPGYKISRCPSGKTPKLPVNPRGSKYSTLPNFGITYISPHSGPRKRGVSRSSRTRAGRRWTWATSARRVSQGGQP
ncbi:hypothetical protein FXB41_27050 [Bradyrhizobium canariense]|nr:hypothetical protein [Bradyrhizobium canariense]